MAHTRRNQPRTPSARTAAQPPTGPQWPEAQDDPGRGQGTTVTRSPAKRAPQAKGGKRHE
jgi:hypothetical protein